MRKIPQIAEGASPYRLCVAPSPIHRFGVFAVQTIPAGRKVIEYSGERMSARELVKRQRKARAGGRRERIYFYSLNRYWGIDGAVNGSGAELINHGCDPNIKSRIIRGHILYYSRRRIVPGEELTIDYRFNWRARRDPCYCGSSKCRGTINLQNPKRTPGRRKSARSN